MGYWTSFCLRLILSVEIKVLGKENIIIDNISIEKGLSISGVIELIDKEKNGNNLASEIRVYALNYLIKLSKKSLV